MLLALTATQLTIKKGNHMPKEINVEDELKKKGQTIITPVPSKNLKVATTPIVIYNGDGGGGPGEYAGSSKPGVINVHEIKVVPGGKVVAAFYQPLDNVRMLKEFNYIDVTPHPTADDDVQLKVAGYAGSNERLMIRITVLYTD